MAEHSCRVEVEGVDEVDWSGFVEGFVCVGEQFEWAALLNC